MFRKKTVLFLALIVVSVFFLTLHYLLTILPATESEVRKISKIEQAIQNELKLLPDFYINPQKINSSRIQTFLNNLRVENEFKLETLDFKELWLEANSWPSKNQIVNISSPNLGKLIYAMKYAHITKADVDVRGTQLKLLLNLRGDQQVVFKPKWYHKEKIMEGPVYAGKDRYGSEIVAFYLSVLLGQPLTPVSAERTLSLKYDILPVATKRLLNTSFERNGQSCIYGKCFYCKKEDPICENENVLTGAVIFNVKKTFSNYRSPWQRTYKKGKKAVWEDDPNYCKIVRNKLTKQRVYDLIDTAIFDFLIQNGDRHHYETLDDTVVWIDNGKGLGNPHVQHLDILAPLYQCCMIREKTWKSLLGLAGGNLTKFLKLMPDIENFLTKVHLKAMEERLLLILATVEYCKNKK